MISNITINNNNNPIQKSNDILESLYEQYNSNQPINTSSSILNRNHLSKTSDNEDEEVIDDDEDDDNIDHLQEEYMLLRDEFNRKLKQATLLNLSIPKQQQCLGEDNDISKSIIDDNNKIITANTDNINNLRTSGSITQSYSENHEAISTKDLVRMWELEDANQQRSSTTVTVQDTVIDAENLHTLNNMTNINDDDCLLLLHKFSNKIKQ